MSQQVILVVDDESLMRWSIAQHLGGNGYRVVEARTAAEARARIAEQAAPELIVLDLKLPDADGLALLDELRRNGVTCPVIVISAQLTPELGLRALAAGASFVLEKPFQLHTVRELVRRALHERLPPA